MPVRGKYTIGTVGLMAGIPFCHIEFMWSLAQLIQYNSEYFCTPGEIVHLVKADLSFHSSARNDLVKQMLGDWLLMLDADQAFAPDLLARMVRLMNYYRDVDVLSGMYHYRLPPHFPLLYCWNEEKKAFAHLADWDRDAEIFPIDSAGGGCLLVRRKVFERIYDELGQEPFSISPPYSEDHSFFLRLKKLGIQAYAAPKIEAPHIMNYMLRTQDYNAKVMADLQEPIEVEPPQRA